MCPDKPRCRHEGPVTVAVSVEAAAEEASSLVLCDTEAEPPATTFRWALNTSTGLTTLGPRRSDIFCSFDIF